MANFQKRVWTCPHKNTVDTNGDCTQGVSETTNCTSYCEMSLSQGWGEFVVIPSSGCEQVGTCSYQQGMTYTTTEVTAFQTTVLVFCENYNATGNPKFLGTGTSAQLLPGHFL